MSRSIPVLTVVAVLIGLWYLAVIPMNAKWEYDQAARNDRELAFGEMVALTMNQERPVLPAPHQVLIGLYEQTVGCDAVGRRMCRETTPLTVQGFGQRVVESVSSNRSLIYHGLITLNATLLGFLIGTGGGILLAVAIVYNRATDASVMPWAIASQTIPIIALAPMIIVVLNSIGVAGLVPKAIIAAYLSFFPVVVGMVKGLRAPDAMQLDLMKTYSAGGRDVFLKLRLPMSMPFLFASLKIGIASALVGTIVGELPVQRGGLGVRLLSGSYYGQTIQIWAALFAAAILAASLVGIVGAIERRVLKRMGMAA
ncbi:ABC transporter permease [Pararhodobacter sp. CCB-MM2]|uniref:ABC transporter permease n=1 Tax=Pararhodobacter sp. CCB-MM2 TaxID=1786003 RepID=UPI00083312DC|nr:ABC transporter permease [Pararhodobacter sp. CCB-MM2]